MRQTRRRSRNHGIRKVCDCPRKQWVKCAHPWHFNYKPKGGSPCRFSLDAELGRHIAGRTEALEEAENIRIAIRAGTFRRRSDPVPALTEPVDPGAITLQAFIATYLERRAKPVSTNDRNCLRRFAATVLDGRPFGETPIGCLTEDTIEAFFAALQRDGRAASTRNKYVQAITALCRWAAKKGYLARNPIAESETIHREQHARRHRRLTPDRMNEHGKLEQAGEERALLAVAGPHLQRLTIGALETCCRLSELLRLTWRDIDLTRKELTIRAETAKTRRVRILPVSSRLAGVLEMAQTALSTFLCSGNGRLNEQERADRVAACFVFGDQAGRRVKCIRKAWDTAVLKAHGHKPAWIGANTLSADSRAALRAIDLHFHDLRHEGGSRLLEAGWPLHHVQEMLGHANVSQTSTYLNATRVGLQESMSRFQESRCNLVAIEGAVERAPLRNGEPVKAAQHQVN